MFKSKIYFLSEGILDETAENAGKIAFFFSSAETVIIAADCCAKNIMSVLSIVHALH